MKTFNTHQTKLFEAVCATISEGLIIADAHRIIAATNKAANKMYGYEENELVGKNLDLLIPLKYQPRHKDTYQRVLGKDETTKIGAEQLLEGLKKKGETFHLEVSINPFIIDDKQFTLSIIDDISERTRQQSKILELNRQLEEIVDTRTQALRDTINDLRKEISKRKQAESKIKKALEKERELNELKTNFLSLVSHEFKTPLSVILSSATLAEKYITAEQQDKREKHLNNIKLKVKSLNNILNDFLSIERIQGDKNTYQLDYFPLSRVINNIVYDANMLSKPGQIITYPENLGNEVSIHYDEKILELALTNLVNNSIKYSPDNSQIDIEVEECENHIKIHVMDSGIGIPKDEQKYIFDPYFRAQNALLKNGTGIGLNIVKGHLEKLNSRISFKSEEGKGSTFTIEIPYTKPIENE